MRVAYFGMPLGALLLARDGHDLVYVALSRDDAPGVRRAKKIFGARAFVRPEISSPPAIDRIASTKPDLIVSWFWTKRLPREVLAIASPNHVIGVHPSLLPRHRGPDPFFWAIDSGDEITGVTAHVLDDAYDTGAILRQVPLRIDPRWNSWTLAKKLDRPSLALLRQVVREYAAGNPPAPRAQDSSRATNAPSPSEDMLEIRWTDDAEKIARRVRAAAPWPGAFTEIGGETIVILDARVTRDFPRALEPGEGAVREARDGSIVPVVRAANLALEIHAARREEDEAFLDENAIARLLDGRVHPA